MPKLKFVYFKKFNLNSIITAFMPNIYKLFIISNAMLNGGFVMIISYLFMQSYLR